MSSDLKKYTRMKEQAESLRRQADRAVGARDSLLSRLQEHGCSTLKEGESLLEEMTRKEEVTSQAFQEALEAFQRKWGNLLEGEV